MKSIKNFLHKANKWIELNLGWFFVNGYKQKMWLEYLKKKYGEK